MTLTQLVGINGTDRVADVAVYVFGEGQLFRNTFRHVPPGRELNLLPSSHYFGRTPGSGQFDGLAPQYVGELIVVVSSEPIIVTGTVVRGYYHAPATTQEDPTPDRESASQSSRTLDVRQFDCLVPADSMKVAQFCRLSPYAQ
jgi:hypothetical protein